jgi:hypothetical protein
MERNTNNKIIEVQEMLFNQMKRLSKDDFITDDNSNKELSRSTALYNQSTTFIKAINTQLSIIQIARRNDMKTKELITKLGLDE